MPTAFQLAHAFTARWEGGLSDHPADPAGLTNHGLSLRWVQDLAEEARARCRQEQHCSQCQPSVRSECQFHQLDVDMDGDVDADDVRLCSKEEAAALFKRYFWDALQCNRLPLPLAVTLYDAAVNMGPGRAVRQLQAAMNTVAEAELDDYLPLAEDGRMGPRTRDLAEALSEAGQDWFTARQSLRGRETFYRNLVKRRPAMQVFLQGWRNRVQDLGRYLAQLERETC